LTATIGFFEELLMCDRKLELDYEYACADQSESAKRVRAVASAYIEGYVAFNNISKETALASYAAMVRQYVTDIRTFIKIGKYPLEIDATEATPSRSDYDLFLILTILATRHRCAVMEELTQFQSKGKCLVIGVGSGIELSFIGAPEGGDAYDLYINPFARTAFSKWRFQEALFHPSGRDYDTIYSIELLEHLDRPYEFLKECREALLPGGQLVVTTATNVPQFDHRFNFTSDEDFESRANGLGLLLTYKRVIPHEYPRTDIGARNVFYVFRRSE
jgi:SAM-dependent methyltransferase